MQWVNFDQVFTGVSRFVGVFHVRTLFLMFQTKIVSHGLIFYRTDFFNSILLFAHVQLNAVVVGMSYFLSRKTDYRNSKGEPTRFSLFHFQQNGWSSGIPPHQCTNIHSPAPTCTRPRRSLTIHNAPCHPSPMSSHIGKFQNRDCPIHVHAHPYIPIYTSFCIPPHQCTHTHRSLTLIVSNSHSKLAKILKFVIFMFYNN